MNPYVIALGALIILVLIFFILKYVKPWYERRNALEVKVSITSYSEVESHSKSLISLEIRNSGRYKIEIPAYPTLIVSRGPKRGLKVRIEGGSTPRSIPCRLFPEESVNFQMKRDRVAKKLRVAGCIHEVYLRGRVAVESGYVYMSKREIKLYLRRH